MSDTAVPRFHSVALDCPDPAALAAFYARLLDWPVPPTRATGSPCRRRAADRPSPSSAPPASSPRRGRRPDVQQQLHIDLEVDDMDAAHRRAVGLGARHLDTQETFRVYADPVGHPFCLCAD